MAPSLDSFVPPHCPRTHCRYHHCAEGWRWERHGSFERQCAPQRIPRFRCRSCGCTFSSQTFSTTYYLKRPELLEQFGYRILACSGYRQIAREARCSPTTVMGQAGRLGRHALLMLAAGRPRGPVDEALVIDGFESFAYSQFHPLHLNIAVGSKSHFTYAFTFAALRRKGSMTKEQKRTRLKIEFKHGRPDPRAIEKSIADLVRIAAPSATELAIVSDEHPAYPRGFKRIGDLKVAHLRISSKAARTCMNPLFPVNLMDLQLRHNSSNHKRETIAYSKRHAAAIERAAWLIVWRNWGKQYSENHGGGTPAMRAGLCEGPLSVRKLLDGRRFFTRTEVPGSWQEYYRRGIDTPGIKNPRRHALKLAF